MFERLTKFTGPKIIKSLEANVAAIRADLLTSRLLQPGGSAAGAAAAEHRALHGQGPRRRHRRLRQSGRLGRGWPPTVIDEGVTLREKQPIFNLPDPQHMRVRAKINESKVGAGPDRPARAIIVDAFPERPLKGVVAEVTPISIPIRGSDVRIYYANVDITEGFDELRPGLSAEIPIEVERRPDVTRVPIESPSAGSTTRPTSPSTTGAGRRVRPAAWRWQEIEIGLSDPGFAEVVKGLKPGDRVIARPSGLPAPKPERIAKSPGSVAAR